MEIINLPSNIAGILENLNAPNRLRKHLQIVYSTANDLCDQLKQTWPALTFNEDLVLFGAATHDIGKTKITSELFESGKEHEEAGKRILESLGFSEQEARFAFTHGNWKVNDLTLEDLLVSLADKIWKGKRVIELEEKVGNEIANNLKMNYWDIYESLDHILSEMALDADKRLDWQNQ